VTERVPSYRLAGKRIWVAGSSGMVGRAISRQLENENCELISVGRERLDLRRQSDVEDWMAETRPQAIFLAAAKVGGIMASQTFPADFLYDNLMIESNIIHAAHRIGVEKLMFLGSSCIYPRNAAQPITEDALLTGALEPSNEWYAIAKIAGIKLCQAYRRQFGSDFVSAMPTNLYGEHDNFDLQTSHVIPALIAKTHAAKTKGAAALDVWGTGTPRRDFLYVDDAAAAIVYLMQHYSDEQHLNVGAGRDISIGELSALICEVVGFQGGLNFLTDKPDGTPLKKLDTSRLSALGWQARIGLREGITRTYDWYCEQLANPNR